MSRERQGVLKGSAGQVYSRWPLPAVASDAPEASVAEAGRPKRVTAVELESLQREAYEEGFAAGHGDGFAQGKREGLEAGAEQRRSQVARLKAILQCLAAPLESLDEEVERSLVSLVMAIARQVVRADLAVRPEQILLLVREAIDALPTASRNVRLYLNPDDLSLVRESLGEELKNAQWIMREDAVLNRGGCRVESDSCRIDASVEHRLACVIAQVLDREGGDAALTGEA